MKRIAFQGELGAFSHQACRQWAPEHQPVHFPTFEEAFDAIASAECDLGMIPVENSLAGRVGDVHHLLPHSGLRIIEEHFLRIELALMALQGVGLELVRTVISHPVALMQCRETLRGLGIASEIFPDTAGSAKHIAETGARDRGAIAPEIAASLYGLKILKRNVEDARHNTTRFLVLTRAESVREPVAGVACMTSFVFRVRNIPSALYKALGGFATNGVNLTKLESYFENGAFAATIFYVDVEGRPSDPGMQLALEELGFFATDIEILGTYPKDGFRAG